MYNRPKLTDSVSVSEMMAMRESGLGNAEIAKRLDTSVASIIKYIGKQPAHLNKPTGYAAHRARKEAAALAKQREEDAEARRKAEAIWNEKLAAAQAEQAEQEAKAVTLDEDQNLDIFGVEELPEQKPELVVDADFPSIMKANREEAWQGGLKVISRITHAESAHARYTVDTFAGQVKATSKTTNLTEIYTAEELQARIDELNEILAMLK